jgi:uncharacterized membrane protein
MFGKPNLRIALMLICLGAVFLAAGSASACPTCKDGMEANDPEHAGMVQGYFYSILFMMGMPYLTLGVFGIYMYRKVRQARAQQAVETARQVPAKAGSIPAPVADSRDLVEV